MTAPEIPWTHKEFREFDRLTDELTSPDQMTRISAQLGLQKFITEHGKEKCDAMFEEIKRRDAVPQP